MLPFLFLNENNGRPKCKQLITQDNINESMKLYFNMKIHFNAETRMPKNKYLFYKSCTCTNTDRKLYIIAN